MNKESEQYIYLGFTGNVFFFSHIVYDKERFVPEMSYQVYNAMINETMITDINQCVVIYDIYPNNVNNVVSISHVNSTKALTFTDKILSSLYKDLIVSERSDYLVFSYNYDIKAFLTYEGDSTDFGKTFFKSPENIDNYVFDINDTFYVETSKDIPYL
jgi:hypothetical protein